MTKVDAETVRHVPTLEEISQARPGLFMTDLETETLKFLEMLNEKYKCTTCQQSPEHTHNCRFYTLLQQWRRKKDGH